MDKHFINVTLAFKVPEPKEYMCRLVNWWCKSDYCHVEIIIDNKWISATPEDGVYIRPLRPLNYDKWQYITLGHMKIDDAVHEQLYSTIYNDMEGTKYGLKEVIANQFLGAKVKSRKWFCSEIAVCLLQIIGIKEVSQGKPYEYTPQDLFDALSGNHPKILGRRSIYNRIRRGIGKLKHRIFK